MCEEKRIRRQILSFPVKPNYLGHKLTIPTTYANKIVGPYFLVGPVQVNILNLPWAAPVGYLRNQRCIVIGWYGLPTKFLTCFLQKVHH